MAKSTFEELQNEIEKLKQENLRLKHGVKQQRFGLVWMDIPEAYDIEIENKLPILEEVKDKAIINDDGKPTHILIEGDNYHALTCLNYTHKEKIDVIYIDPPYNTGNDGFCYKDKRIVKEFPDGTLVPKDSPFRHSYWLSFMSKRLELAKYLLKDTGILFISIDDNEMAQLKILCDQIFGENSFINNITLKTSETSGVKMSHTENKLPKIKEYLLVYAKNPNKISLNPVKISKQNNDEKLNSYLKYYSKIIINPEDKVENWNILSLKEYFENENLELTNEEIIQFKIDNANKIVYRTNNNTFKKDDFQSATAKIISARGIEYIWWEGKQMLFLSDYLEESICDLWIDISTINLNKEICDLPAFSNGQKPIELLKRLLNLHPKKKLVVLDFFAGSGTTMHATMALNSEDNGNRQVILVTNNENKICENITYERNKRVISGYIRPNGENIIGLKNNSLRYYKTNFIGKNNIVNVSDEDKTELAHNAGYLLAIAENTLNEIEKTEYFQFFENQKQTTAIYYREDLQKFSSFIKKIEKIKTSVVVYIFSWGDASEFESSFELLKNVRLKNIPAPILEIYKQIYKIKG